MVRKGWSVMELPSDGWVKVLRGRRPPSVQSQKSPSKVESNHFSGEGGRNPSRGLQRPRTGCTFQVALKVLGPDEQVMREGLEASLLRAKAEVQKPSTQQRISQTPDSVVAVAREKVAKLEKVMEVLQGSTGAEVDAIGIALDRARVAAQEKPLTEQIADCKGFVERAQRGLVKLEAERDAENALLEEGRARLARLEAQAAARVVAPPPPPSTAVSDLEAEVARLRAELAATHVTPADQPAKKPRLREDFVPNTVEEAGLWLKSRQQEMDDAIISGNTLDVARLASAIAEGASQLPAWTQPPSLARNQT